MNSSPDNETPRDRDATGAGLFDMNLRQASWIFWGIAFLYGIVWTILPGMLEENYRYDVIEMFFIGREGVVSTFKHPALNSAVLEIVYQALGQNSVTPFLLSQICFVFSAWCVWRLSLEFLTPFWSLISSLCFFGYWSFFYKSLYYNHNVTLFPVWGLITLLAYRALKKGRLRDWVFLGLAIGLGMHCKYTVLVLVASILIFMTLDRSSRKYWLTPGPYLTTLVSLLVAVPQIVWLFQSDFSCLRFPELEYGLEKTFANRCYALCNDALISIPVFISSFVFLLCPFFGLKWKFRKLAPEQRRARNFLFVLLICPFGLQALTVFMKAIPMEFANFMQLYLFLAPLMILAFESRQTFAALRTFFCFFVFIMIAYVVVYSVNNHIAHHGTNRLVRHAFPGRQLAEKAENIWHRHYDQPLPYVVGAWWFAGNVAIYGKDRPCVHTASGANDLDDERALSNWSTDEDVRHYGGLVFWKDGVYDDPEAIITYRFPGARIAEPIVLKPNSTKIKAPIRVGVAIIPPDVSVAPKTFQPAPWHYFRPKRRP